MPLPWLISPRPDLTAGDGEGGVRAREPVTRDGEGRADGAVSMKLNRIFYQVEVSFTRPSDT